MEGARCRCSRARSSTLRINYRTSHQIRMQADRLLGPEVSDVDGNKEERHGTVFLVQWAGNRAWWLSIPRKAKSRPSANGFEPGPRKGIAPHEMGVFVRSGAELTRARAATEAAGLPAKVLDDNVETTSGRISIGTMHLAKGLEFRAVAVMALTMRSCPLQERIETVTDDADPGRSLQHGTAPALRRLHSCAGSPVGDERGPGIGVLGRSAELRPWNHDSILAHLAQ